VWLDIAVAAL